MSFRLTTNGQKRGKVGQSKYSGTSLKDYDYIIMLYKKINGVKTYSPESENELMEYALVNKKILVVVNAEKILHATDFTRRLFNDNLGYPDGFGAVMALKQKGIKNAVKIAGCDLWLDIIQRYYKEKTFYLIGGKPAVIADTVRRLRSDFPGVRILDFRDGYIKTEKEKEELLDNIAKKKPDIVFVAMGSPRQELLMGEMQNVHPALYQGLGGSFDVYTGTVKRAPQWWIANNLEWAYRLLRQPSRIKRQIHLVRFFVLLKLNRF